MLYFTIVHLCSKWFTIQILLKVHLGPQHEKFVKTDSSSLEVEWLNFSFHEVNLQLTYAPNMNKIG